MQRPVLFRFRGTGSAEAASGYTLVEILVSTSGGPDSSPIRAALAARGSGETSCGFATPIASYRGHPVNNLPTLTTRNHCTPAGYTLVEILVSTALSLILLGAVVRMFGDVGQGITNSRAMLEAADRLRLTAARLQQDLAGITVPLNSPPPHKPENNEGYFEYIEGPVGVATMTNGGVTLPLNPAFNTDNNNVVLDTTVGDFDDILMFTTRSTGQPFVGRCAAAASGTIQSDIAEVAWFVRGRTLYRRVLLVAPSAFTSVTAAGFYTNYDVSARPDPAVAGNVVPNTLGDLTKRENRFAHQSGASNPFPYSVCQWCWQCSLPSGYTPTTVTIPTLPTLRECAASNWSVGVAAPPGTAPSVSTLDFWSNAATNRLADTVMNSPGGARASPTT